MNEEAIIILTSISSVEEGERIAFDLVENRLAACVKILPNMTSIYRWKEKIHKENEFQLIISTTKNIEKQVYKYIKDKHSYELPEIITLEINNIDRGYREWLNSCLKSSE